MDEEPYFPSVSESQLETFLGALARHLIHTGNATAAAVVTLGSPTLESRERYDHYDDHLYDHHTLKFAIEEEFFHQIFSDLNQIEEDTKPGGSTLPECLSTRPKSKRNASEPSVDPG
jgi:hypothetical protein